MKADDMTRTKSRAIVKQHNAAAQKPIAHERQEAQRMAELIKKRYAGEGLAARYLGEDEGGPALKHAGHRSSFGVGWWKVAEGEEELPRDVMLVSALLSCLNGIDVGETEGYRLLAAKRLVPLLRFAQEACGELPQPAALGAMTPAQQSIIRVMYRKNAVGALDAMRRGQIVELLDLHQDTVGDCISYLRTVGLVNTTGKPPAGIRYILSPEGVITGKYLYDEG